MENSESTLTLKVDLRCCEDCHIKVKKRLKKMKGVTDVKIDVEQGLVTVTGAKDASTILKAIKKVGKKPMKYKHEKDLNDNYYGSESSSDDVVEDQADHTDDNHGMQRLHSVLWRLFGCRWQPI